MKRILILLTVIILASCSKNNDSPSFSVEGSWLRTDIGESVGLTTFQGGNAKFYKNDKLLYNVTYKQDGDKITMTPSFNDEKYVYKISQSSDQMTLSGISNNFTLTSLEATMKFKRK